MVQIKFINHNARNIKVAMEMEYEKCFLCYSLNSGTYKSLFVILNEKQITFTILVK